MPAISELAQFLNTLLCVRADAGEPAGLLAEGHGFVQRLGLALEPWPGLRAWLELQALDAIVLHRPWHLTAGQVPAAVGILAYHRPFDQQLTTGYNRHLAVALRMYDLAPLRDQQGRTIGMLGRLERQPWDRLLRTVVEIFRGVEATSQPAQPLVSRIAVANAMSDWLVRAVIQEGSEVYLTGQYREPARQAVAQTGIGVIATGHGRAERWGLRCLANLLRQRWPALEVVCWEAGETDL